MTRNWLKVGMLSVLSVGLLTAGTVYARHGRFHDPERMKRHILDRLDDALDDGPPLSAAQHQAVEATVDKAMQAMGNMHDERRALLERALEVFEADKVDPKAVAALRQEQLARINTMADEVSSALTDLHEILTPAQRKALVAHARDMHERFEH